MREPNWVAVFVAAAVVFLGGAALGSIGKRDLRDEAAAWRRTAAERDALVEIERGRYRRAAVELDGAREAAALVRAENEDLARELRRARAEVRALQTLLVETPPDTVVVTATDTVLVETGETRVDFRLEFDAGTVEGYTLTPPPRARGVLELRPVPIVVTTSELRDGSWRTDVAVAPPYRLGVLESSVNPRRPSWWERVDFAAGAGVGVVGTLLLLIASGGR